MQLQPIPHYQIPFYPLLLFSKSFNHWAFSLHQSLWGVLGVHRKLHTSPFLSLFLGPEKSSRDAYQEHLKTQEQDLGQDCVTFSPRIVGNCIIKGAREARVQWKGDLVQGIRGGSQADLRKQTLKRTGTGQEVDGKVAQEISGEPRVLVGRIHPGCLDKQCIVSRTWKTIRNWLKV